MKVKRFTATSMQVALREVSHALGDDAVIISTKYTSKGIEVVAAIDYREENAAFEIERQLRLEQELEAARAELIASAGEAFQAEQEIRPMMNRALSYEERAQELIRQETLAQKAPNATSEVQQQVAENTYQQALELMQDELRELKELMLRQKQQGQAEDEASPAATVVDIAFDLKARLRNRLADFELDAMWVDKLVENCQGQNEDHSWQQIQEQMVQDIPVAQLKMFEQGGRYALIGASGSGKTTTIGKIAAQFVINHGSDSVALVSLDDHRVAAHDQLRTFARILDVELHVVNQQTDLNKVLDGLADKKLVLVDSAGLSKNDPLYTKQLAVLRRTGDKLTKLLALPLTAHQRCLKENYQAYKLAGLAGCVLTKMDESYGLGAGLSVAHLANLPVALVTNGVRVPDDIQYASAYRLFKQAEAMVKTAQAEKQAEQRGKLKAVR